MVIRGWGAQEILMETTRGPKKTAQGNLRVYLAAGQNISKRYRHAVGDGR